MLSTVAFCRVPLPLFFVEVEMLYDSVFVFPNFEVERDYDKCIVCKACVQQCTFDATF